jgi:uncharacterized membrane protein YdbT with pleckstrin-like domain
MVQEVEVWSGSPSQLSRFKDYCVALLLSLLLIGIPYALWIYLDVKTRRFELTTQRLKVHSGVLSKKTDELELYRVKDTRYEQPLMLRLFGLGNVIIVSSDSTSPVSMLSGIKDGHVVRERIRELVEERREQKRVRVAEVE